MDSGLITRVSNFINYSSFFRTEPNSSSIATNYIWIKNESQSCKIQTQLIVFHEFDEAMKCDLFLFYRFWEEWGGILGRAVLGRSIYDSWPHYKKKEGFDLIFQFFVLFFIFSFFFWVFEKYRQKSFIDFLARKIHKFK